VIAALSFGGYSAQNLIFRYLRYFLPVAVVFILSQVNTDRLFSTRTRTVLAVVVLGVLLVTAPINLSREMTETPQRIHTDADTAAIDFHRTYGQSEMAVEHGIAFINLQQVYQVEFHDYRFKTDLPITPEERDVGLIYLKNSDQYGEFHGRVYANAEGGIYVPR
jgi:hypothetical protein